MPEFNLKNLDNPTIQKNLSQKMIYRIDNKNSPVRTKLIMEE